MLPQRDFMEKVERVRMHAGFSLPVTSAARCPAHNALVSATGRKGPHTTGRAIDFGVRGAQALTVARIAIEEGFTGIGINQKGGARLVHIDDLPNADGQPRPTIWSY